MQPTLQTAPAAGLGISSATGEQAGGPIRQIGLDRILTSIEGRHLPQQLDRFEFVDRPGVGLIPGTHRITGETQQVVDAEGMGAEQLRLQGKPVAVTAGELQHRFKAPIQQQPAHRHAAHAHHRPTAIGDVDRMHASSQLFGHGQRVARVPTPRGHHLGRDRLPSRFNRALERRCQTHSPWRDPTMQDRTV